MKKITTLIVDDEPLAREGIAAMLEHDPDFAIVGSCADGLTACAEIREKRPDLVFLDVQMPQLNGFETLERLPPQGRPAVIFLTAYDGYAIPAFEIGAVDYLLKPFRDVRFRAALDRAKDQIRRTASRPPSRLVFKVGSDYVFVAAGEIAWIEAQGDLVKLGAGSQPLLARESLQSVEKRLDPGSFVRIHRSFIVNLEHIRRVKPALYGDYTVLMSDGIKIRLSRSYRDKLKAWLPERPS
jgi:two-component system, LytTR family, response regulator